MVDSIFNWFTITADSAGEAFYWATPLGSISLLFILISSLYDIYRKETDLVSDMYNWVLVIIVCVAFMHIHENSNPKHQMMIIITALAIRKTWDMFKHLHAKRKEVKSGR